MTITIAYPDVSFSAGYGLRCRLVTSQPFAIGDFFQAWLRASDVEATNWLITARAPVAGSSRQGDIIWGWDAVSNAPSPIPLAGPAGAFAANTQVLLDMRAWVYDGSFMIKDGPQEFLRQFVSDPVSDAGMYTLTQLWNQAADNFTNLSSLLGGASDPSSYSLGTAHAGLTGHGSFSLAGAVGVLFTATTSPPGWGTTSDTPPRFIPSLGSVQAADSHGRTDWHPLHYSPQLVFFKAPWATSVQWNLRPGWVGTLQLLTVP